MSDTDISNNSIFAIIVVNIGISLLKPLLYRILHNKAIEQLLNKLTVEEQPKVDTNQQIDPKNVIIDIPSTHEIEQKK